MNPHDAMRQIAEIRERLAGSQVFRGFRSLAVAFSGVAALAAATLQPHLVPAPADDLPRYLLLWVGVAAASLVGAALGVRSWARTTESTLARERGVLAFEQILPAVIVGAVLTLCLTRFAPDAAWMLPGLWSLVFSLAVFALRTLLPPMVLWVGAYYVVAGTICLLLGRGDAVLAPWQMGLCFGGGQLLGAAVLHWTLERSHAEG